MNTVLETSVSRLLVWALLAIALAGGCTEEKPPPFAVGGGGKKDAGGDSGEGGSGGDGGKGGGGSGGDSGSGGSGGDSGSGGSGGSGDAGGSGGAGGAGGTGAVELPDSPESPWIAFVQIDGAGFGQLFFVKADGTGLTEYGGDSLFEVDPAWSPDGDKLAFTAIDLANGTELHVLDFSSGTDKVLPVDLEKMSRPRWSPSGTRIVVTGSVATGGKSALFRINASTGAHAQITKPVDGDGGHDYAPDGTLYFVRNLGSGDFDIFSVSDSATTGDAPDRVTTGSEVLGGVGINPDGKTLLYARVNASSTSLIEHTLAGDAERTIGEAGDEEPEFFSGGDFLVVSRDTFDSDSEIAVTDLDGTLVTRCTDNPQLDASPAASPVENADIDVAQFE